MRLRRFARAALVAMLAPLALAGCSKKSPTAPATISTLSLRQALNAALPATVTVPSNLDTTASILVTLHMGSGVNGGGAAFVNGGKLVDAGLVWLRDFKISGQLDSVQMSKTIAGSGTLIVYSTLIGSPPPVVNLAFDGVAYHAFSVGGSAWIGAFIDSVQSVDDLDVASPADNATITRSSGLTVTWSDAGADTGVKVTATVIANSDSTLKAAGAVVDDPAGSTTIPPSELNRLPAGGARLAVARYRLVYRLAGGGNTGFACETIVVRNLTLN